MRNLFLAAAVAAFVAASPAAASHIFVSNVKINGVALDSIGGPTDPTFNLVAGGTLDFTGDLQGEPDTLNVTLNGFSGANPNPFLISFAGGQASFSQLVSFSTSGSGSATFDFPDSFPDYIAPNGDQFSERTLGFSVNVISAVPEPGTWAMMLVGFGAIGGSMRRRKVTYKIAAVA